MAILSSKDLLQQQLAEISELQAAKTKPVELPKDIGVQYNASLQKLVRAMNKDINKAILPQVKALKFEYTADSWVDVIEVTIAALKARWNGERFNQWASRTASTFINSVNQSNQEKLNKQFKSFGINVFGNNTAVSDYLDASVKDNVRLITSIQEQYLTQVESIVLGGMRQGSMPSAITEQLQAQFGITKRRARVISRDQTSKAANGLAKKRMESAGVKYFQWLDSNDQRVRTRHRHIANNVTKYGKGIYSFDDLPIGEQGVPVAPGDPIQCRCVMRPVLESEIKANIKAGRIDKGVRR